MFFKFFQTYLFLLLLNFISSHLRPPFLVMSFHTFLYHCSLVFVHPTSFCYCFSKKMYPSFFSVIAFFLLYFVHPTTFYFFFVFVYRTCMNYCSIPFYLFFYCPPFFFLLLPNEAFLWCTAMPRTEFVYNMDEGGSPGHTGLETERWQVKLINLVNFSKKIIEFF